MKIFLSFSGVYSKEHALAFKDLIENVIQPIKCLISSDIRKGNDWYIDIIENLEKSDYGVVFLSRANKDAPWINFEVGALRVRNVSVSAILLGVGTSEISPPLNQFQHTFLNRDDTFRLLKDINSSRKTEPLIKLSKLERAFSQYWPEFQKEIEKISLDEYKPSTEELLRTIIQQNNNSYYHLAEIQDQSRKMFLDRFLSLKRLPNLEENYLSRVSKRGAEVVRLFFGIGREWSLNEYEIGERFDLEPGEILQILTETLKAIHEHK